jgi:Fe2+ transport system protein FeoA
MVIQYLTCPLCGFEFDKSDTLCSHGCPLGAMCKLMRCPSCSYEFPEIPAKVSWVKRLFRRKVEPLPGLMEEVLSLKDLTRGETVKVLCIGRKEDRSNNLAVFGLIPGCEVTLIQQAPACVIRVGETEVALDDEIAREILVERVRKEERKLSA